MNARQKAKKYKKELDELKKLTVKPVYVEQTQLHVESLVVKHGFLEMPINLSEDVIKRQLVKQLINDERFIDLVEFEAIDPWNGVRYPNVVEYGIRLDVARR